MAVDLLTPRIIIEHTHPHAHFKNGTILRLKPKGAGGLLVGMYVPADGENITDGLTEVCVERCIADGSNVLRKLNWWEYRTIEDLPLFVRFGGGAAYKMKWDLEEKICKDIIAWSADDETYPLHLHDKSVPCTEAEYLATREYFKNKFVDGHEAMKLSIYDYVDKYSIIEPAPVK